MKNLACTCTFSKQFLKILLLAILLEIFYSTTQLFMTTVKNYWFVLVKGDLSYKKYLSNILTLIQMKPTILRKHWLSERGFSEKNSNSSGIVISFWHFSNWPKWVPEHIIVTLCASMAKNPKGIVLNCQWEIFNHYGDWNTQKLWPADRATDNNEPN